MSKKLLLNSLSGTSLYLINIVVAFIMSPVIIRALGNRDYGLWELVMSVIGYMGLMDLGIGPALVRFVSVADGKQDHDDLQQTISTSFVFFVCVGGVAVLLFAALGYSPDFIAGSEMKDIANLGTVFLLLGINAGLIFPLHVFTATLMGVQRHYFINSTRGVLVVIRALLTFYLLQMYLGKGLIILALLEPIFTVLQFALFASVVYFDKNLPKLSISAVTWNKLKELFTFGTKSATMLVASRLQNQSVPLIIGNVIGLGSIVYFVMPNRLINYAKQLSLAIGFPLTPYFGAAVGRGDQKELLKSWLNTTLALQIVALVMPLVILFYGETFLGLWIGPEYALAGRWVIYILLVGLVADSLATNAFRILTAHSMHGRCATAWFLLSVISIPLGILGASLWGVAGVALGTTLATVVGNLVTIIMACSVMNIDLRTYFKESLMRLFLPLMLLASTLWILTQLFYVESYTDLLLHLIFAGIVYVTSVWYFTLSDDVRCLLREKMRARLSS